MAFSQQSFDFLFENRLHDDKEWFRAHKADYEAFVLEPMRQLIADVAPTLQKIDELIDCSPKRISRLYRDARFAKDSVFRDYVWCTFGRTREQYKALPSFYFDIGTNAIGYGCGYYVASAETMEAMRRLVLENDSSYIAAALALSKQKRLALCGDNYKRSKFPDESPEKRLFLDKKNIWLSYRTTDRKEAFSDKLSKQVAGDFKKIAPVYDFFMKAESLAAKKP